MRTRVTRRRPAIALALAALLTLPGCVVIRGDQVPSWVPRALIPSQTVQPKQSSQAHPKTPSKSATLNAYFVKAGRLVPVARSGKPADVSVKQALQTLLEGPTSAEEKQGIVTAIPEGTRVLDAEVDFERVAHVDFSREFAAGGSGASVRMRLEQVVYTATQLPGVNSVIITLDGKRVESFGKERVHLLRPQTRNDFTPVAPPL